MFLPTQHSFIELDFSFQGKAKVYEHEREGIDQSSYDTMRLNTYLSQDGDFVTVWWGLIDATMTEIALGFSDDPTFNFREQYEEPLFRGYIPDNATGATILTALRFERMTPNILTLTEQEKLECHAIATGMDDAHTAISPLR